MPGGRVELIPSRGSSLTLLVASPPDRSGGVGGWVASERAKRRPGKWHRSIPDDTMSLELIIDAEEVGGPPVERRLRVLRDMGQPGSEEEPPTIRVRGDIWKHDRSIHWVMEGWSLGERLYYRDGTLRRQYVTVELSRYAEIGEVEAIRIRPTRGRRGQPRRRRPIDAKAGDTLRSIALRELGDATRWQDVKRWNPKLRRINPDVRLRTGTQVHLR